ncbi:Cytochrome P450 78A11 [Triticum urartu]|uniref:Cytochrome P450 78A11 n=1 Tax=Triticum urartu TaxID=4572 RepID=M8AIS0_TRIUA|nr:Cytochrome P450 78A11 [Triticum urartu]
MAHYDVSAPQSSSGEVEELLEMVHEGYELLGKENWCDYFPGLAAVDPQGIGARCAELMPRVNRFVHGIIREHRAKATLTASGEAPRDFVDILLSLQDSEGLADADIAAVLWVRTQHAYYQEQQTQLFHQHGIGSIWSSITGRRGGSSGVDLSEVLRLSCEMAAPLQVRVRPRRCSA